MQDGLSVSEMSVFTSVKRVNCDKNERNLCPIFFFPQEKSMHLILRHEELLAEIPGTKLTPFKNGDFQSIFARSASAVIRSEKSLIMSMTNKKSTTRFPISLK